MSTNLTIVQVSLDEKSGNSSIVSPKIKAEPSCIIQTTHAKIFLFNKNDDRMIHAILKEVNRP